MDSKHQTKRRRRAGGLSGILGIVVILAGLAAGSSSAAEDPRFPGLPKFDLTGDWVGPRATGVNYAKKAKQWVRVSPIFAAGFIEAANTKTDTRCGLGGRLFPYQSTTDYHGWVFFRSGPGSRAPFGYQETFVAKTVAFGSIPVEASVQLRQLRDAEDLPVGLEFNQKTAEYCPGQSPFPDRPGFPNDNTRWEPATMVGQLNVAVTKLKVDGVDLRLTGNCQTATPAAIDLKGREFFNFDPSVTPEEQPTEQNLFTTPFFGAANGGLLNGTVDIPAFSGCTVRGGEDVSRVLTSTISGPDNPVTMRSEGLQTTGCLEPGVTCAPLPGLPFPAGE